ncbi:MAG: MFS transporter [Chloroflexi bacterium]|nr:MFS transporter [Chloroflexota bacterium]
MDTEAQKNFRHNFSVSVLDGGFFGLGLGFISYVTILPLFVSQMTDSALLIGLISSMRGMGWQLPQLFTVNLVAKRDRYKPLALFMTIQERWPVLGFAAVAWFLPGMDHTLALIITFALLTWNSIGAGLTAVPWQSLIAKIVPPDRRGIFFGTQAAGVNLASSITAVAAGLILERVGAPANFTLCFLLGFVAMALSWGWFASIRESPAPPTGAAPNQRAFWSQLGAILRRDANFRWFIIARMIAQMAVTSIAFYTVFAVKQHGMGPLVAGIMTSVFTAAQIGANAVMGWLSDRLGHKRVMQIGILCATFSAVLAWLAPDINWFYAVFTLAGIANVAVWTIAIAMTLEFGTHNERPAYIGLANTLVAPSTIVFPLLAGTLADIAGYPAAFAVSAVGGLATAIVIQFKLHDPRRIAKAAAVTPG